MGLLLFILSAAGCTALNTEPAANETDRASKARSLDSVVNGKTPTAKGERRLKVVGNGLMLGSTDNLAFDERTFAEVLEEQYATNRWGALQYLLRTYPDIAMALLLHGPCDELPEEPARLVASSMDQLWEMPGGEPNPWLNYREASGTPLPKDGSTFSQKRSEFLDLLTNHRIREALQLRLMDAASKTNSTIAELEAQRLVASAMLLGDQHRECIPLLRKALQQADTAYPVQASRMRLLLAEALRHTGESDAWATTWREAVVQESRTLRDLQFQDPTFWKQAAFQRPIKENWPDEVVENFRGLLDPYGLRFPEVLADDAHRESIVWAVVGVQSQKRHESQNAILAFKKSEALLSRTDLKNELLLQQALAMIDGGQAGPASPILYRLSSQPGTLAARSRAVLGAMKLQHGSLDQGINLLNSAMQSTEAWPAEERLRATADYGLALLIAGQEAEGLACEEEAFREFAERGLFNHAAQCLANCARYFDSKRQNERYAEALSRLQAFESDGLVQ